MLDVQQGSLLWEPAPEVIEAANLTHYMRWLAGKRDLHFSTYTQLWRWSVTEIEAFWESLWEYFGLRYSQKWSVVLESRLMPGARWFPGARLNFAENIFALRAADRPMMLYQSEWEPLCEVSWAEAYDQVGRLAAALRGHWGIENRAHWVRDVVFDEDRSQVRSGAAPQVLAAGRNLAIALLRRAGYGCIAAALRTLAGRPACAVQLVLSGGGL